MRLTAVALLALCSAATTLAQPVIKTGGVVNGASWSLAGELNSNIAQGSIFIICGSGLGPKTLTSATTFPLPTTKGLADVTVTIATTPKSTNAILLWVRDDYIAAVLPSTVPVGRNQLTVTYNGQTSAPEPLNVTPSSIGILTQSTNGSGPGLITDATKTYANGDIRTILVTPTNSAMPGDTLVLWSTGVGPVAWDESAAPPASPGDLQKIVKTSVYIGDQVVTPTFAGRSGCCAGLDQIQFKVPANISGCQVPIAVMVGGVVSNFVTTAIDESGGNCSDPFGFSSEDIAAMSSGSIHVGSISYHVKNLTGMMIPWDVTMGQFVKLGANTFSGVQGPRPSLSGCVVNQFLTPDEPSDTDPYTYSGTGLDAGSSVFVTWTPGSGMFIPQSTPGEYSDQVPDKNGAYPTYTFKGSGGADVGSFNVSVATNAIKSFRWTNPTGLITRNTNPGGLTITWTGGDPNGFVEITNSTWIGDLNGTPGIGFVCEAPTTAGQFHIPKAVIDSMFAGGAHIAVTAWSAPVPFKAKGLDKGWATIGWESNPPGFIFFQ